MRLLRVRWEHGVTNKEIAMWTGIESIKDEIQRRGRCLGHIMYIWTRSF